MVELNKVFTIEKNGRKIRWKIVEHPYFDSYALVKDHLYLKNGKCSRDDANHINYGGNTLEEAYKNAFDLS